MPFLGAIAAVIGEATLARAWKRLRPLIFNGTTLVVAGGVALFLYGRHVGADSARAECQAAKAAEREAIRQADAEIAEESARRSAAQRSARQQQSQQNQGKVDAIRQSASKPAPPGTAGGCGWTADELRWMRDITSGRPAQPPGR